MTTFDYAILFIVGMSIILSVMRGAVRDAHCRRHVFPPANAPHARRGCHFLPRRELLASGPGAGRQRLGPYAGHGLPGSVGLAVAVSASGKLLDVDARAHRACVERHGRCQA